MLSIILAKPHGTDVSNAKREVERIRRISKPVWRACKVVAAQMRDEMYILKQVPAGQTFDWARTPA